MGPTLLENKCILIFFATLLGTFVILESYLWLTLIPNSTGPPPFNFNTTSTPCTQLSPFCLIGVKELLLDWMNFYVYNPLSVLVYEECLFATTFSFISANSISVAHVVIAACAGRLIAHDSICIRRLGVIVFETRNFLDAFDGTVAKARSKDNNLPLSSVGYYVDGVCDGFGCAFLLIGCLVYLKNHPVRKNSLYSPLSTTSWIDSKAHKMDAAYGPFCLTWLTFSIRKTICKSSNLPYWLGCQWFTSSTAWNRYIARFTSVMESPTTSQPELLEGSFLRRNITYITFICWRIINVHAMAELLLVSIFLDKMAEFMALMHILGWILIFAGILMGEIVIQEAQNLLK